MSGVEATRRPTALAPDAQILILAVAIADHTVVDAVRSRLQLPPQGHPDRGVDPRHRSRRAGSGLAVSDASAVVLDHLRTHPEHPHAADTEVDLSWRELEVLGLLVEGKEKREIGQALSISPGTVKHHISSILTKLNVPNRTLAAVEALSRGLASIRQSRSCSVRVVAPACEW
jgi:DNA-binding NarL/FixJ family response regulator